MIPFHRSIGPILCASLSLAAPAWAGLGDCGQPVSSTADPLVSDAHAILRAAVGRPTPCDPRPCICDVNGLGGINTGDALAVLRLAVGHSVELACDCGPLGAACTSASFTVTGSELDLGWTGIAHDQELWRAEAFFARVKRRCSATSSVECVRDADCPGDQTCLATCDCTDDVTCELSGPTQQPRCRNDLDVCETNADCDGHSCLPVFGPPVPISAGGTPICVTSFFESPLAGSFDAASGEVEYSTTLRSVLSFGITLDAPCPRCGSPEQNPEIGDEFTCEFSAQQGEACQVDAVTEGFGGTSFDCPPQLIGDINPTRIVLPLRSVTTGTATETAQLPCKGFAMAGNPTVPGSNPKCTDKLSGDDPVCTSNADCLRCSEDVATSCASNGDCADKGFCAEAPDQPVTCGFWCHCGFCDQDPSLPCFDDSECPDGQTCQAGTGTPISGNVGQQRPNDCSQDNFICGSAGTDEECATTQRGLCSEQSHRSCATNGDCESAGAGTCELEPRPCFGSRITRSGEPSPLGAYCALENKTCDSDVDCAAPGDECVASAARPETVALVCVPGTTSVVVNTTYGITGPAALRLNTLIEICRCGDGVVGCEEECDDGNDLAGDGCDDVCADE
jgi:hypothetical protein